MPKAQLLCWVLALGVGTRLAAAQSTRRGATPAARLIDAVQRRDQSTVQTLIADGADVNAVRDDGS
ncbi:MAG: hypothetical protein QF786_01695, partial [Vicinamibacterales bacterium]|nr:hypothetical protein [Vicinamibacterales bacterium]